VPMDTSLHDGLEGRGESRVLTRHDRERHPPVPSLAYGESRQPQPHTPRPWQPSQNLEAILGR
jgi:hypothetical protein